jgi:hypothetical protein
MPDEKEEKIDRNDPRLYRVGDRFNIWHGVEREVHACVLVSDENHQMVLVDLDLFESYVMGPISEHLFAEEIEEIMSRKRIRIIAPERGAK